MKLVKCRWNYSLYGDHKNIWYDGADWINLRIETGGGLFLTQ